LYQEITIKENTTMTREDKELLLKDLGGRLPYGVKCIVTHSRTESGQKGDCGKLSTISREGIDCLDDEGYFFSEFGDFKPYLFPLSSMNEEQKNTIDLIVSSSSNVLSDVVDFYNKYHLDWRGLIPKGLASDATGLNIY
jgi:hypothetical protein